MTELRRSLGQKAARTDRAKAVAAYGMRLMNLELQTFTHQLQNAAKAVLLVMRCWSAFYECPLLMRHNHFTSAYKHCNCWRGNKKAASSFWQSGIIFKVYHCLFGRSFWECWGMTTELKILHCKLQNSIIKSIKVSLIIHPTLVVILITRDGKVPHFFLTSS